MRKTFTFFTALLISAVTFGQLNPGDIAFIGYNSDWTNFSDREVFSWIALVDMPVGETIYFTDEGVRTGTDRFNDSDEGHYSFTVTGSTLEIGTIVTIKGNATSLVLANPSLGTLTEEIPGFELGQDGDQILAYTTNNGTPGNAQFIAGIHADRDVNCEDEDIADLGWSNFQSQCSTFPDDSKTHSQLPSELTNGVDAVAILGNVSIVRQEFDNARYNGNFFNDTSLNLTGGTNALRALINDRTKWTYNVNLPFSIQPQDYPTPNICLDADIAFVDDVPFPTVCSDNQVTLEINGDLNDADQWAIYADEAGEELLGTTTTNSFVVTQPERINSYYVRGEYVNNNTCVAEGELRRAFVVINEYADALFFYEKSTFTTDEEDPEVTLLSSGGTFISSPEGLSIDPSTGKIDVSESIPGHTYTITYTTAGECSTFFSRPIDIANPLKAGDIAFIGYNSDDRADDSKLENFTWISLVEFFPSQQLFFTQEGVDANGFASFNNGVNEGHFVWTAPTSGLPAGTIVHIERRVGSSTGLKANVGTVSGVLFDSVWRLSGSGDQILAYTSDLGFGQKTENPVFIAGIHLDYNASCVDNETNWSSSECVSSINQSALPNGLTNGVNAISLFISNSETDNARFDGVLSGNPSELRRRINDRLNWTTLSDDFIDNVEPDDYTLGDICFVDDTTVSYEFATYSFDDPDPLPTITGIRGGTFSSDGISGDIDLDIDPVTGKIDLSESDLGTLEVRYRVFDDCTNAIATVTFVITIVDPSLSTPDITNDINNVTIYQSSKETITINGLNTNASVSIYNLLGSEIVNDVINLDGSKTINIPTSINAGIYIVKLSSKNGTIIKKIILK